MVIFFRLHKADYDNIHTHFAERGEEVLDIKDAPFGYGWRGDKNSIYEVRYRDKDGNIHLVACKTGLFSGMYFGNDTVVSRATPPDMGKNEDSVRSHPVSPSAEEKKKAIPAMSKVAADLEIENKRLIEEVRQLRTEVLSLRRELDKRPTDENG